jgi:gentisate 1,2-dioxygenase
MCLMARHCRTHTLKATDAALEFGSRQRLYVPRAQIGGLNETARRSCRQASAFQRRYCEKLKSPIFSHPCERSREALETLYRNGELDEWDGVKLRYVNPTTGGWPIPTMATFMQYLPAGFDGRAYRSTNATVYCVVEGKGRARVGDDEFLFEAHDIFVTPSWERVRLSASDESVLFSYSDRPVLAALNLLREERS